MRLILISLLLSGTVFASDDCRGPHNQCGHEDDFGNDVVSESDSSSNSQSDSSANSSAYSSNNNTNLTSGRANVESKNSNVYLGAARDTADCFTKVQIGAEGFGLGWSRSDKYCKKVRLIADNIARGNTSAAARLECTLDEWKEVYQIKKVGDDGYNNCLNDLTQNIYDSSDEAASEEHVDTYEFQARQEVVEYQMAQQQQLIDTLRQEHESDLAELAKLKALEKSRRLEEAERRAKAREILKSED